MKVDLKTVLTDIELDILKYIFKNKQSGTLVVPIKTVCKEYGCSQPVGRNALRILVAAGIITMRGSQCETIICVHNKARLAELLV